MKFGLIKLHSFAKINLGLHIVGKRTDGYHEIRTLYQTIMLHDNLEISIKAGSGLEFNCNLVELRDENNLVVRAIEAVRNRKGVKTGFSVQLQKQIPMGSGLGGGSSNAAVTIMALDYLLNLKMSKQEWFEIGEELGADVPFFFLGGRAIGLGRGSEVYSLQDHLPSYLLIVISAFPIATVEAYRQASLRLTSQDNKSKIPAFCPAVIDNIESGKDLENHFESVVFKNHPSLKQIKKRLLQNGATKAGLTGSGSAIVGFFDSKRDLRQAPMALRNKDIQLITTRTTTRKQYQDSLVQCFQQETN